MTSAPNREVSVIIPSRNRPRLLFDAVRSVLVADEVPAEIVIVDQSDAPHPSLGEARAERGCVVRYLATGERGVSRARNTGIRAAAGGILAFIDDDCLVAPTWLTAVTRALAAAGEQTVVTGRVVPGQTETARAFVPSVVSDEAPVEYAGRIPRDVLFSGNMAFFRGVADDVGPFDERLGPGARFPAAEDNDFAFRLLEKGYRIRYVSDAVVTHRAWRARSAYLPLRWAYGRGQAAFFAKHLQLRDRFILRRLGSTVRDHLGQIRGVRRNPRMAAGSAVYLLGMTAGAAEWLLTQRTTTTR